MTSDDRPHAADVLIGALTELQEPCLEGARAAAREGLHQIWWELDGYARILEDAIERIRRHRARCARWDQRIAQEGTNAARMES